jgi:uncharacterized iron-regulated protein
MKYLSILISLIASAGFAQSLPQADVYILGETHDNAAHHAKQADWVSDLSPKALVFEMLPAEAAANIAPELRKDEAALAALDWWGNASPDGVLYAPILLAAPEAKVYGAHINRETTRAAMGVGIAAHFGTEAEAYGLAKPLPEAEQTAREAMQLAAHCDALPAEMLPVMVDVQRLRDAGLARATAQALAETGGPVAVITGNGHARKDWGMPVYLIKAHSDVVVYSIGQGEDETAPEGEFDHITYSPAAEREDPCAAFAKD